MTLEDVLASLQEPEALDMLRPYWDESVVTLPNETPEFLQPEVVTRYREYCGFTPDVDSTLIQVINQIKESPALFRLAWHCHRLLFDHLDYNETARWPSLTTALGTHGGTFYLLVAMSMIPRVQAVHKQMGVSEEVTRDTCRQIWCFASNYQRATGGQLGIPLNQIYWLRHYTAGRLFRIGRMEYMLRPYAGAVQAYRSRKSGQVVALAPDGVRFNHAGFVDSNSLDPQGWTASLHRDEVAVVGNPISPRGFAINQQVRFALDDWECVLQKDDTVLEMHIPAGGGMTLEKCGDSMRRAAAFFQQHFPDQPFRAMTTASWILNTQLEEIPLKSDHLVQFQRELYLYPVRSSGQDGLWFIFLQKTFDLANVPRETSLQKAIANFLDAGHAWRGGGMFFLVEHLGQFGIQVYRSSFSIDKLVAANKAV